MSHWDVSLDKELTLPHQPDILLNFLSSDKRP